ncbi:amidoligase family protein [Mucilaginibacter sp. HMF5004]|uniref:hypothetical protein n=1 Tax=Mucilaginibacter rivuli TaxID=2857527 RepID=UPI001C5D7AC1|nr:hypothetical protein [Mucilaginibacter rivuli]MBW4889346.1 amidoligase family protein [Mucilaginibacter rivuli]
MISEEINTDITIWLNRVAKFGITKLTPYSSKETRDKGNTLIILSCLSILISFKILNIKEESILGLRFDETDGKYVILILVIVCLYLLSLYLFDIYQEKTISQLKSLISENDEFYPEAELDTINKGITVNADLLRDEHQKKLDEKKVELGLHVQVTIPDTNGQTWKEKMAAFHKNDKIFSDHHKREQQYDTFCNKAKDELDQKLMLLDKERKKLDSILKMYNKIIEIHCPSTKQEN